MIHKFFDKKTGSGVSVNEQLAEDLHKPVTKRFKRRKVYARFKGNNWEVDLAEMGSLSSKKKNFKYLLCVIDVFNKCAWVKFLKDKKGTTVLNDFIESNCKPNKLRFIKRFIKTLKLKTIKKPVNANYSALTEKIETDPKTPKFKVNARVRITKYENIFSKGYTET